MRAIDAEALVIGAMIRDNSLTPDIAALVDERDFTSHFARKAFAACQSATGAFDETLVALKIGVTHTDAIRAAVDAATNPPAALEHAKRIAHAAIVRRLIDACTEASVEARDFDSDNPHDVIDLVTRHQNAVLDVSVRRRESSGLVPASEGIKLTMREISKRADEFKKRGEGYLPGPSTGYPSIDILIGGLQRKAMIVVGAQTGVGKSAMALNMATGAVKSGAKVVVLSHEMSTEDVFMRRLAAESRVWSSKLQNGKLEAEDFTRLTRAVDVARQETLWVTDSPPRTVPRVMQACLQHQRRHGLDVLFVDYLQLMDGTRPNNNREQVVSEIARGLKQLAMDLDVCVVALAQLNNNVSRNEEPHLSSLRESSAIAQNANSVILLWAPDDKGDELCFKVAKNRSGPHGAGSLQFRKAVQLITERLQ